MLCKWGVRRRIPEFYQGHEKGIYWSFLLSFLPSISSSSSSSSFPSVPLPTSHSLQYPLYYNHMSATDCFISVYSDTNSFQCYCWVPLECINPGVFQFSLCFSTIKNFVADELMIIFLSCLQLLRVHTGIFNIMVVMSVLALRCGFTCSPTHIHTDRYTLLFTQRTHADSPLSGNVVSDQRWLLLPNPLISTRRGFLYTLQASCPFNSLTHAFPAERSWEQKL